MKIKIIEPIQGMHVSFSQRTCKDKDFITIYCNIFINDTTADFSTGIRVPKKYFCAKSGTVKRGYEFADERNSELSAIMRKIMLCFEQVKNDNILTAKDLKNYYQQGTAQHTLLDYYRSKKEVHQHGKFDYSYQLFEKFCHQSDLQKISIRGFNKNHVFQYRKFLEKYQTKQGIMHPNTVKQMLEMLKLVFSHAIKEYIIERNVLTNEIPKSQAKDFVFLEKSELEILKKHSLTKACRKVADLFLFQSYTGFAYSDVMSFDSKQHIICGVDDKEWIKKRRQKTKVESLLPLFEPAKEILEKYNFKLPKISLVCYNKTLERISKKLNFKKITTHTARKTACMLFLESDFDSIALMVGHNTAETTRAFYAKVRPIRIINQLKNSDLKW